MPLFVIFIITIRTTNIFPLRFPTYRICVLWLHFSIFITSLFSSTLSIRFVLRVLSFYYVISICIVLAFVHNKTIKFFGFPEWRNPLFIEPKTGPIRWKMYITSFKRRSFYNAFRKHFSSKSDRNIHTLHSFSYTQVHKCFASISIQLATTIYLPNQCRCQ